MSGPSNGTLTLNPDGFFTYTPDLNFNGTDSFTYRANDGELESDPATVAITVDPVNDAPVLTGIGITALSYRENSSAISVINSFSVDGAFPIGATGTEDFIVTALSGDRFVASWSDGSDLVGQVFDVNGEPVGAEFTVSGGGSFGAPSVARLPPSPTGGSFVIAWSEGTHIRGQIFDSSGLTIGGEFPVDTSSGLFFLNGLPSVTGLDGGGFAVTWERVGTDQGIWGRTFDAGQATSSEFPIYAASAPTVTGLSGGGFVATWIDESQRGGDIFGQVFDANGQAVGQEFPVNTSIIGAGSPAECKQS